MSYRSNFVLLFIPKIGNKAIQSDSYKNVEFYKGIIRKKGLKDIEFNCVVPLKLDSDQILILSYKNKLFFSIRKFYEVNDRTHVVVYCYNSEDEKTTRNVYYTSKSDGSFWRYCIKREEKSKDGTNIPVNQYAKGYSYVSSTFVNIYLQEFINSNQSNFNIVETKIDIDCTLVSELTPDQEKRICVRMTTHPFLLIFNNMLPSSEYMMNNYKKSLLNLLEFISGYLNDDEDDEFHNYWYKFASELFCELTKKSVNNDFSLSPFKSRRTFYTQIMDSLYSIFFKYFVKNSDIEYIFSKKFKINGILYSCNIGSINLKDINFGKEYILFYFYYRDLEGKPRTIILHMINKDTQLTKFGLDDNYCTAGVLISKIYDYESQSTGITKLSGDDGEPYNFLGDIFNCINYLPAIP